MFFTVRKFGATPALLAHTLKQSTDGKIVTTDAIDTTGATVIVISYSSQLVPIPTDNKSNTWTEAVFDATREKIYHCINPTVGSGHTFTLNPGVNGFPTMAVSAYSGANPTLLDTKNNFTASGTSLATGSITPSQDNVLLYYAIGDAFTDTTMGLDVGTILNEAALVGFVAFALAHAHEIQTAATTRNPTWSWSPAARAGTVLAAFGFSL